MSGGTPGGKRKATWDVTEDDALLIDPETCIDVAKIKGRASIQKGCDPQAIPVVKGEKHTRCKIIYSENPSTGKLTTNPMILYNLHFKYAGEESRKVHAMFAEFCNTIP